MSVAELPIQIDRERIARFCQERGIRKLSLFGSVLRDDFDPQQSDVDVLAELAGRAETRRLSILRLWQGTRGHHRTQGGFLLAVASADSWTCQR